ncbi:hypothetical protein LOTGIDRAFT_133356, partial [Lottia gigantea]
VKCSVESLCSALLNHCAVLCLIAVQCSVESLCSTLLNHCMTLLNCCAWL